jgi:hypothetical protein
MNIDTKQLEINVNLYALQPDFLNLELHYVLATNENTFRFALWDEEPQAGEERFYCFLTDQELVIPAGNIVLKESYALQQEPVYPVLRNASDFCQMLSTLEEKGVAKGIRQFKTEDLETIQKGLQEICGSVALHVVTSSQAQHRLMIVDDNEISISATMVYFRRKAPFAEDHYHHVKEDTKQEPVKL